MIASWMLSAMLFTACLALGAAAADTLVRASGRPTRWIWCTALAAGALWPSILLLAAQLVPPFRVATARLPMMTIVPDGGSLLGRSGTELSPMLGPSLLALWIVVSVLLAIRLARTAVMLRAIRAQAEPCTLDGMPVLVTNGLGPATIGLRRSSVLVPRTLLELDPSLRSLVLRHEREHCTARDPLLLLASGIAVTLFPWNVPLWLIARRLRLALEIDCDARVLASGAEPTRYGQLLL